MKQDQKVNNVVMTPKTFSYSFDIWSLSRSLQRLMMIPSVFFHGCGGTSARLREARAEGYLHYPSIIDTARWFSRQSASVKKNIMITEDIDERETTSISMLRRSWIF